MSYFPTTKIDSPVNPFGELRTSQRTPLIELESTYGISNLRDNIFENGIELSNARDTTLVTVFEKSYKLTTTAAGTSSVTLESAERGRYMPGFDAECGIGLRFNEATTPGVVQWGYFDRLGGNGFYFKRTATGLSICRKRNGIEVDNIPRAQWDDPLDGTGISGVSINDTHGYIWQIEFVHYGYGTIEYVVEVADQNKRQKRIVAHRINDPSNTSIIEPNLPITVYVDNTGATTSQTVFVTGRQFSVGGKYIPNFRTTSDFVINKTLTTTFQPVLTYRRKEAFRSVRILPEGYDTLQAADIIVQFRVNTTLTGAVYGNLNDVSPAETSLEKDISATSATGGEKVFEAVHSGGRGNSTSIGQNTLEGIVVPSLLPITMFARTVSGTTTTTAVVRMLEEW